MTVFFYICDYFEITPSEFFNFDNVSPEKTRKLAEAAQSLDSEQLDHLIAIAYGLQK